VASPALLLLDDVTNLPSYMKVARLLQNAHQLSTWAQEVNKSGFKSGVLHLPQQMPRVPLYATRSLTFS
jgi:hypothetical protein